MGERIPCCVPFCRRTARADRHPGSEEIICCACWSRIPPEIRARRAALRKRSRRLNRMFMRCGKPDMMMKAESLGQMMDRLWARNWEDLKRAAIEAAGGIG